jgi:hypothetical protein
VSTIIDRGNALDAFDRLIRARQEVRELLALRGEVEDEDRDDYNEKLAKARIKAKQAGERLRRYHPDAENLPIEALKWTPFSRPRNDLLR